PSEQAARYAQQLDELKARVVKAQQDLSAFHQRNGLVDPEYKTNSDITVLTSLEERLVEAQNARRVAEAKTSGNPAVGDQVMSSALLQQLKTQLATQQSRLAELQATLGPQHPQIIELNAQIAATRRAMQQEQQRYIENSADTLKTSRELETSLQKAVDEQ